MINFIYMLFTRTAPNKEREKKFKSGESSRCIAQNQKMQNFKDKFVADSDRNRSTFWTECRKAQMSFNLKHESSTVGCRPSCRWETHKHPEAQTNLLYIFIENQVRRDRAFERILSEGGLSKTKIKNAKKSHVSKQAVFHRKFMEELHKEEVWFNALQEYNLCLNQCFHQPSFNECRKEQRLHDISVFEKERRRHEQAFEKELCRREQAFMEEQRQHEQLFMEEKHRHEQVFVEEQRAMPRPRIGICCSWDSFMLFIDVMIANRGVA